MGGGVSKTKPLPKSGELALFKQMDADGSGALSVEELKAALAQHAAAVALTWHEADINQVIDFFDRDGDGQLDEREFAEAVAELKKREAERPAAKGPAKLAPIARSSHSGATVGVAALDDKLMSQAKGIFGGIDNSSDGFVQKAELRRALWELKRSSDGNGAVRTVSPGGVPLLDSARQLLRLASEGLGLPSALGRRRDPAPRTPPRGRGPGATRRAKTSPSFRCAWTTCRQHGDGDRLPRVRRPRVCEGRPQPRREARLRRVLQPLRDRRRGDQDVIEGSLRCVGSCAGYFYRGRTL